tara:strand:+ start:323 stop:775 length:453 start_codon:yes stop_codon:yes gene_type:complete
MARMPKIKPENLKMYSQIQDEHLKKYIAALPDGLLTSAGLVADVATGRWFFKGAKSAFPKVLDMLRKGIPPSVKAATPSISNRYQDATVMDWDAESASFKPESMKPKRSPGRTTGTVPKKKKQQQKAQNKAKVQKRKKNQMRLSLRESPY